MKAAEIKYIVILIMLLVTAYESYSQAPTGQIKDVYTMPNGDTLLLDRKHGQWWFGGIAGTNLSTYYDSMLLPKNPYRAPDSTNPLVSYPAGYGAGLFAGIIGEWLPPGEYWGGTISVKLLDWRNANTRTGDLGDSINTRFQSLSSFIYLTVSPSVRYNTPIEGLHLIAGLDVELLLSHTSTFRQVFEYTGRIEEDRPLEFSELKTRLGVHLGIGHDIFMLDINHKIRVHFTPFATINVGTPILSDYGSKWNTMFVRLGLQVKFGPDIIESQVLPFDSNYISQPVYLASLEYDRNIEFPGFFPVSALPAIQLAYIEKPEIIEEISEKLPEGFFENNGQEPEKELEIVEPGMTEVLTYSTSAETKLSSRMKDYLDRIAETLKANPGYEVRIQGHSDNTGTFEQNMRRSIERTNEVVRYLMKKGVQRGRMLDRGRGALEPSANNATVAGRRKNRRVEITIVP